jgi:hypothetical protein
MSADYKTMSREQVLETLDLVPSWAFWRLGCHTFAKNVVRVIEMAGEDDSEAAVVSFIRSLPFDPSHLSRPEWREGFCSKCLKKAFENVPEAEKKKFEITVLDYFLYYFPDRDRITKFMLIDAFVGIITGMMEAQTECEKGGGK